ncbi:class C sortase [Clostridium zeae]|uniref:Class C sortase n=1 Tax=Clostridium zeae TaxID=2759022 RepID=A0ABQ1EI03_9CLOT|nr:sortase [Clostridium zeae]GFZ34311.1 class C sortase [Clostridium zeae]
MKSNKLVGQKKYIFLFILGMLVFMYPTFSNAYYSYKIMKSTTNVISPSSKAPQFSSSQEKNEKENNRIQISDKEFQEIQSDPAMKPLLNKDEDYIKEYNKRLWNLSGCTTDPFHSENGIPVEDNMKTEDKTSIFAYIKINKIHQTLPIYLGATDDHLNKGVAVIQGTSIPVGGENTNSVIAGHTGQIQKFFTDLPELVPGDIVEITNHWQTLYYKVTGNKVILPDQQEYLNVVKSLDMITLLTCYSSTPKNDRLLVFAERYYPYEENEKIKKIEDVSSYPYLSQVELKVKPWYEKPQTFIIGFAVILVCLFIYTFFSKKKDL